MTLQWDVYGQMTRSVLMGKPIGHPPYPNCRTFLELTRLGQKHNDGLAI